ncbi:hypothetical protein ACQP2P_14650 [Dactylosporangium sp. CA-139114]|uniref:hypothetical protein n=1 Tax=Dactylosporangium sp. CA-139114 TaxID=3239931 RepID=UPI003D95C5E3
MSYEDDAIRGAVAAIADRAHAPQRITAGLDARTRVMRQRRLVLRAAGAAVAVAAVGGGLEVYRSAAGTGAGRPEEPGSPKAPGGFPKVAGGPGGGWLEAAATWRPTFLPDGYGQVMASVLVSGGAAAATSRGWAPAPGTDTTGASVTLIVGDDGPPRHTGGTVSINGVEAEVLDRIEAASGVTWVPAGGQRLTVIVTGSDRTVERDLAVAVAESLRPDSTKIAVGPRLGFLPEPYKSGSWWYTARADLYGPAWSVDLAVNGPGSSLTLVFGPAVQRSFDPAGAEPVRVRGADGLLSKGGDQLFVPQDGYNLSITAPQPGLDLPVVAQALDVGPVPDISWYGSR